MFIFENVRGFLRTKCEDLNWEIINIEEAIEQHLWWVYNISSKVINFKEYGVPSSRTRTVVIWTHKKLIHFSPYLLFPDIQKEVTLKKAIWKYSSLKEMWQIQDNDIYHNFRNYDKRMLPWVQNTKIWTSAFDNKKKENQPHRIINWEYTPNKNKNWDKYSRCVRDKVWPCIHTRNDILASQSTIHPVDNRVFSVRELMTMMSIPKHFRWVEWESEINASDIDKKRSFIKKNDINIRQSIWEAVPTAVFQRIAEKISRSYKISKLLKNKKAIEELKQEYTETCSLDIFSDFETASYILELLNAEREKNKAYYTNMSLASNILKKTPKFSKDDIYILEPSVWLWNFVPLLLKEYWNSKSTVTIDLIDIDKNSISLLKKLLDKFFVVPQNIKLNYINSDYLKFTPQKKYDLVIWNPPFGRWNTIYDKTIWTNNLFAKFLAKATEDWNHISLVIPKSFISSPKYNIIREKIEKYNIFWIVDFWEFWFPWVKIETIGLSFKTNKVKLNNTIIVTSYIDKSIKHQNQQYICDDTFPYWLLYRNVFFDNETKKLNLWVFSSKRSRSITKSKCLNNGKVRVISSRNINRNWDIDISSENWKYLDIIPNEYKNYYCENWWVNNNWIFVFPNLTYKPRVGLIKNSNTIPDWSLAILTPKFKNITKEELSYVSSEKFEKYYRIARNYWTRSLNIDKNSVHFIWIPKKNAINNN